MVAVKICGLSTAETLEAALRYGADLVGFVFYPKSPRNVLPRQAKTLAAGIEGRARSVALIVDADDRLIGEIAEQLKPDLFQAHGSETPERVAKIKSLTGIPVIKAIKVATAADVATAAAYQDTAAMILFDAKAPESLVGALPGGNGLSFDWSLLGGKANGIPWMLSGGLNPENVANAIRLTGAQFVDVSSGVESAPGIKDIFRIRNFIEAAKAAG
jgi:phosphoribosylanthranilate isomerase